MSGHDQPKRPVTVLRNPHFIHLDLFELPFWVLVEAADADVTDALTVQGILLREMCQEEIYDP